jgi:hypothetical protein
MCAPHSVVENALPKTWNNTNSEGNLGQFFHPLYCTAAWTSFKHNKKVFISFAAHGLFWDIMF